MLKSPEIIQNQLSESISYIGREDFPFNWNNLLPQMVLKFASGDFNVINGVLRTAHSLFRRYRHEFRSDTLWMEIKMVLEQFAQPLTKLLDVSVLSFNFEQLSYLFIFLLCRLTSLCADFVFFLMIIVMLFGPILLL